MIRSQRLRRYRQGRRHHRPRHGAEWLGASRRRRRIRPRLSGADDGQQRRASGPISSRKFSTIGEAWIRPARELSGDNVYTLTFPKDGLPAQYATFFWSVIAVDGHRFRVLPNPINRFLLNNQSKLQYGADGSLTLVFRRPEACRRARRQLAADAERTEVSPDIPVLPADGRRGERHLLSAAADQAVRRQEEAMTARALNAFCVATGEHA